MKTGLEFYLTTVREDLDLCDFTTDSAPELCAQFDNYLHEYKIKTDWNLVVHDCEDECCNVILHCNDTLSTFLM